MSQRGTTRLGLPPVTERFAKLVGTFLRYVARYSLRGLGRVPSVCAGWCLARECCLSWTRAGQYILDRHTPRDWKHRTRQAPGMSARRSTGSVGTRVAGDGHATGGSTQHQFLDSRLRTTAHDKAREWKSTFRDSQMQKERMPLASSNLLGGKIRVARHEAVGTECQRLGRKFH